ncbi:F-box protein [Gracilariopsis chorda]|uniref:F-box protein n=1 Tax=Gracilariopsis chorda TaxID=448386 RepID=A0A2V3IUW0_9FLOR|nr:F-box protein [Gracilariopsis chorda]|eukprot:PXF45901.1 F-box protein [Gracilariopsis chorda]
MHLATVSINPIAPPDAAPPPLSSRSRELFHDFITKNAAYGATQDAVPTTAAAALFQLLSSAPHGVRISHEPTAPTITVNIAVRPSDFAPKRIVLGNEALRLFLWHVFHTHGYSQSSCGFIGCAQKCCSVSSNRTDFQLQRVFRRAADSTPTFTESEPSPPTGSSSLLRLPTDVLVRISYTLSARDHCNLSAAHPFFGHLLSSIVPGMKLRLYPHQVSALRLMQRMERRGVTTPMPLIHRFSVKEQVSFIVVADLVDGSIYQLERFPRVKRPRGGLLCDEPGLGKTITTLSHILKTLGQQPCVPRGHQAGDDVEVNGKYVQSYKEYISSRYGSFDTRQKPVPRASRLVPALHTQSSRSQRQIHRPDFFQAGKGRGVLPLCRGPGMEQIFLSQATLIIVPPVLTEHWKQQIELHVESGVLRVLQVHSRYNLPESAQELAANYDVIIISFDVIAGLHTEIRCRMPLLLKVHFFRVIVDEGHRISSSQASNFAVGCEKLKTDIRWVMTGTPTPYTPRTDIDHFYSLISFIRDEAYGMDKDAWRVGIREPYMKYKPESLDRLCKLLEAIMIRADKSILKSKCHVRNVYLHFSEATAASYNGLVTMGRRNLITSDWFDEEHLQSLLNKRNRGPAHTFVSNLRKACCFGGSVDVNVYERDLADALRWLHTKYERYTGVTADDYFEDPRSPKIVEDMSLEELLDFQRCHDLFRKVTERGAPSTRLKLWPEADKWGKEKGKEGKCYLFTGKLHRLGKALRDRSGDCDACAKNTTLPFITPCAHLLCDRCLVRSRTRCVVAGCLYKYEMGSQMEPKDLIELQPSIYSQEWRWDWDRTDSSSKMLYLVERISSLPLVEVWDKGSMVARKVRPKVIVHSEQTDHLKLAQLYLKQSEALKDAYVDMVWNQQERSKYARRCTSATDYARQSIKYFAEDERASVLLMNSRLGAVGLDLSFVRYIFLLEPLWDAAQEMQIISRAHRIGCVSDIVVERLIMRGSIEEGMLRELQGSVNEVEEASAAGLAEAKAEKDDQKRRNIVLDMRVVRSMQDLQEDGEEGGMVAKVTELMAFVEETAEEEGRVEDGEEDGGGWHGGEDEWAGGAEGGAEGGDVDVRAHVMATRRRKAAKQVGKDRERRERTKRAREGGREEKDGGEGENGRTAVWRGRKKEDGEGGAGGGQMASVRKRVRFADAV